MWLRWVVLVTAGELLGFSIPALVATFTWDRPGVWPMVALLAAGAGEGAVLGMFQARALRPAIPDLGYRAWVAATALGALVAWSVAMALTRADVVREWPASRAIPVLCTGGAVVIAALGVTQWVVLRRYLTRAGWWIAATALSWAAGLTAFALFTSPLWHQGQPAGEIAAIGIAGGFLMAAVMAAVSGGFLSWLLRP
ncbi:hypothetical protein ACIGO9_16550 [Nocardia asteroides]|uniref:hypothetical protein n=1 Tax=Nocardia asteroides TaxID=1824 RepID=UPI0037C8E442